MNTLYGRPILVVQDPKLVADLFANENENSQKIIPRPIIMPTSLGIMTQNGHRAMDLRRVFSKFFYTENLINFTPLMASIFQKKFSDIKKNLTNLPDGYKNDRATSGRSCLLF